MLFLRQGIFATFLCFYLALSHECITYDLDTEQACTSRNNSKGERCEWCAGCWDCKTDPKSKTWGCSNFCHHCRDPGKCYGFSGKQCTKDTWPACCQKPTKSPTRSPTTLSPTNSTPANYRTTCISRNDIIERAWNWTHKNVSTNHCGHYNGYRTDCSGFVDYCLHIPSRATSGDYHDFTSSIRKDDLRMGDAIVCPHGGDPNATDTDGGHVVLFHQWENSSNMTKYWLFELCNHPGCRGTYHRLAPYPYDDRASCFLNVAKGGGPRRRRNLCKPTKSPTKAPTTNAPTTKAPSS